MVGRLLIIAGLAGFTTAAAQVPVIPNRHPNVAAALVHLRSNNEWTLEQQRSICEIPAPPFKEANRALEFQRRLRDLGLTTVRIDEVGNVIAVREGRGSGPRVVLAAHLDTVFPEGTDVTTSRSGTRLSGPGIADDCRGLAVLLAVARALNESAVTTDGAIILVGTVGEEGEGNLRGVRHLFEQQSAGAIDFFISVDGAGYGTTNGATGSHRYRITMTGPGGHSYGAFGMPNPIHALGRVITKIAEFSVPSQPKTTFNVGVITGGTSVNSIAFSAALDVDLRSESQVELDRLDGMLKSSLAAAVNEEKARWPQSTVPLTAAMEQIGKRPAGLTPAGSRIVRTALAAAGAVGAQSQLSTSSTDANIPISLGIPAIAIDGGGDGRGAHSLDEWYDDGDSGWRGPQWALLIVTALAGVR